MAIDGILAKRLDNFVSLDPDEHALLARLTSERVRRSAARTDIVREGEPTHVLRLFLSGWACRYRTLEDGRRQILAFLLPGDLCDLNNYVLSELDHSIGALTPVQYVEIQHDRVAQLMADRLRLAQAFWWHMLTSLSIQREWTLNLSRSAFERIGNLFCELFFRLRAVGLTQGRRYDLPITQIEMAEATGLTPVHVNRTLQEMRSEGLIILKERVLDIPDIAALQQAVLFSPTYLHLRLAAASSSATMGARQVAESG
ncbi:Crp/Fnr family transcriptional regulator [Rhizorhabdus histidinilytica]|uniref:Crp/Fnr family transcriptional regulator n=1 Tax=Rhizorhabdus histidinilytica TaxID=439228 RepID=UPI00321F7F82